MFLGERNCKNWTKIYLFISLKNCNIFPGAMIKCHFLLPTLNGRRYLEQDFMAFKWASIEAFPVQNPPNQIHNYHPPLKCLEICVLIVVFNLKITCDSFARHCMLPYHAHFIFTFFLEKVGNWNHYCPTAWLCFSSHGADCCKWYSIYQV